MNLNNSILEICQIDINDIVSKDGAAYVDAKLLPNVQTMRLNEMAQQQLKSKRMDIKKLQVTLTVLKEIFASEKAISNICLNEKSNQIASSSEASV